jgi:hypothetical protein
MGYGQGRFRDGGWEWLTQLNLAHWTPTQAGRFLALVPDAERNTWEVVTQLGADVMTEYWRRVPAFYHSASTEDVEYAVSMLLKYNRPFHAVRVLNQDA